ncbi:hypothetical protein FQA39_LY14347 [Lamprigera yunnana]|nr:hypothetical protein FQA39_LY14347 [Lamprigera yunnana]
MYKPRRKEDTSAERQTKDLAATIRINQLTRNDADVPKLHLKNFDLDAKTQLHKRGPVRTRNVLLPSKSRSSIRTMKVSIPHQPKWESSKIEAKKSGDVLVNLREKYRTGGSDKSAENKNLLDEVSLELDISNAQLEQVKQLLESSSQQQKKTEKVLKQKPVPEKNKFLLTLNNVHQRMQKMQHNFFTRNNAPYRSVKAYRNKPCMERLSEESNPEEDTAKEETVTYTEAENRIIASAKEELSTKKGTINKALTQCELDKKFNYQAAIMKSNFLRKEFKNKLYKDDTKSNNSSYNAEETFFSKLEDSFKGRPFGKNKPIKNYWPVALKDSLYRCAQRSLPARQPATLPVVRTEGGKSDSKVKRILFRIYIDEQPETFTVNRLSKRK